MAELSSTLFRRLFFLRTNHGQNWRLWSNRLALILIVLSLVSGIATYVALSEAPPFGDDPDIVFWLIHLDFVLLLSLVILIAQRIVGVWSGRKRGIAGSHLHVRLVYTFSILAAAPAVLMTIFSVIFFHYGVEAWFSQRVQTAVNESQAVAQAYLEEHKQVLRSDAIIMANDLSAQGGFIVDGNTEFDAKVMNTHSRLRNLPEALIFTRNGDILSRSRLTFVLGSEEIPFHILHQADDGDVVTMTSGNDDRLRAIVKLSGFRDTYLFVGRLIDPKVLSHLEATQQAVDDYDHLQTQYSGLQVTVIMIFVVIGLLMLLAAIWFGLVLARQLVIPIRGLVSTADRVRGGDYKARVRKYGQVQEFDYLARSFNRMTVQIEEQQNALIDANRLLDDRRRFTEMVLSGVSSGVIGLGEDGCVNVANFSATQLLGYKWQDIAKKNIADVVPEFKEPLDKAYAESKNVQAEIDVIKEKGAKHIFLVRIAIESVENTGRGAILTFDDITELQSAQRKAAWSDVARRIAHEIKNPLTPIQLSAERLKKKYLNGVKSHEEREVFEQCTDTIIRHVEDIGRMVDEFSSFARMPAPIFQEVDLLKEVHDALILQQQAYGGINFSLRPSQSVERDYIVNVDPQQVRQALVNLIQNAVDSVKVRCDSEGCQDGAIDILVACHEDHQVYVIISDNGRGLPKEEDITRLAEPYVTHKQKGTGLGLAIVKKIMEDHNGQLIIGAVNMFANIPEWKDLEGASVALVFKKDVR